MNCVKDKLRMSHWVLLAFVFYGIAFTIKQMGGENLSTIFWKVGHLTVAAHVGYWVDRGAFTFSRLSAKSSDLQELRRAIIITGAMLAVAMGM